MSEYHEHQSFDGGSWNGEQLRVWLGNCPNLKSICEISQKKLPNDEQGFWMVSSGGLGGSSWAIHEQYPQGYYTPTPPPPRQCVEPSLNTQLLPPSASSL